MAELYGVCQQCGDKLSLGDSEHINIEDASGQVIDYVDLRESLRASLSSECIPIGIDLPSTPT